MSVFPETQDPTPRAEPEPELRAPRSKSELFVAFTWLALQGFGGVMAVAQRELVERLRWLSKEQFVELLSLSQVLPGPNVINMSLMFGDRHFGWRGALTAVAGMLAAPLSSCWRWLRCTCSSVRCLRWPARCAAWGR
jgi:chromate transporter